MDKFLDVRSYDYDERVKGFWNKYPVQIENNVVDSFLKVDDVVIVKELPNSKILKWEPKKSELDGLFI